MARTGLTAWMGSMKKIEEEIAPRLTGTTTDAVTLTAQELVSAQNNMVL